MAVIPPGRSDHFGTAASNDIGDTLDAISQASARSIDNLKTSLCGETLRRAVCLLNEAGRICVIGPGAAAPVAVLLGNGLSERGLDCLICGAFAAVDDCDLSSYGSCDLLIAIELPGRNLSAKIVDLARARGIPVLAITESMTSAAAGYCHLRLPASNSEIHGEPVLAGTLVVAQLLLLALERTLVSVD